MNSGSCSQTSSSWKLPIALKLKIKQSKNLFSDIWIFAFAKELLRRVGQGFGVYGVQGLFKSGIQYIAA